MNPTHANEASPAADESEEAIYDALDKLFSQHEGDFTNSVSRGRFYWSVRSLLSEVLASFRAEGSQS